MLNKTKFSLLSRIFLVSLCDMYTRRNIIALIFCVSIAVSALVSCSTQKNTGASRWWHSFNARYNTYYNGSLAYIEGSLAKENGNKDNYTEMLPLYTVGNKGSRELGKSNYETAILKSKKAIKQHSIKQRPQWNKNRRKTERDIEWLSRKEYNPFLWKAWMLMGRSQFHMGAFDEAAATFSYMSRLYKTQPAIYGKARAWLAKCYIEQDWMYDAEDIIRNMHRDSIDWRAQKEWDYTLADYHLHTGNLKEAAVYLRKVIRHEMRSKQKAREWFLLGQVYAAMQQNAEAYDAFKHVVRLNPPYELEFNARIAMTEVMPAADAKRRIKHLRRMARSDNNAEYLDQVYYAMGNVYLAEKDTAAAIHAYEKGNEKATRSGIEKGVLLLHLGDLYWQMEKFSDARRCYGEAIGLLDKDRDDYEQLAQRSKVLDELTPHTDNIHLQDSLQQLALMSEADRNAAIDRVIEALKQKEKEEKLAQLEEEAQRNGAQGTDFGNRPAAPATPAPNMQRGESTWYFYNPMAVQQGKQAFAQKWGKRENADNWQRMNKTVVATGADDMAAEDTAAMEDSLLNMENDSINNDTAASDSTALDPHNREYYLAQIPFTEEQKAASNAIIAEALFYSGVIFKDKLDNLPLSEKALLRLTNSFAEYEKNDEAFYHLFLLYSRDGDTAKAAQYKQMLATKYPDSQWTKIVIDPYFEDNARYGVRKEDSLYTDTYEAFKKEQYDVVARNGRISEERYPIGANRDKFLFIGGLTRLNQGDADSCCAAMHRVVKEYPQSDVAVMAGMIINGVEAGRKLYGAKFDIADIWNYRTEVLNEENDTTEQKFSDDPNQEFIFLMTYNPDSIGNGSYADSINIEHKLLYEIARYNFTSYLVRNFDITIEDFQGMHRIAISGFNNFNEALVYARNLYQNKNIMSLAQGSRNIIINRENLQLLGTRFSYNDYDDFYNEHFAPLPQPEDFILNEQVISPETYNPEMQENEQGEDEQETDNEETQQNESETGIMIIEDPKAQTSAQDPNAITVMEDPKAQAPAQDSNNISVIEEPKTQTQAQGAAATTTIKEEPKTQTQTQGTVIAIDEPKATGKAQQTSAEGSTQTSITIAEDGGSAKNGGSASGTTVITQQQNSRKTDTAAKASESRVQKTTADRTAEAKKKAAAKKNATVRQDINADVIEIIDDSVPKKQTQQKKKEEKKDDDDEYFELEGF